MLIHLVAKQYWSFKSISLHRCFNFIFIEAIMKTIEFMVNNQTDYH